MYQALTLAKKVAKTLDYHKGENVRLLNVEKKTPLARFYIIVSAPSLRRVRGYAEEAEEAVVKYGGSINHIEGKPGSAWFVVDAHDIVIHVFSSEAREHYDFDNLYKDCPEVDYSAAKIKESI